MAYSKERFDWFFDRAICRVREDPRLVTADDLYARRLVPMSYEMIEHWIERDLEASQLEKTVQKQEKELYTLQAKLETINIIARFIACFWLELRKLIRK